MISETVIFIGFMVAAITVFDIYIILKKGAPASISAYIIRASRKHPSIPFLIGFLAGHLFWSMSEDRIYDNVECVEAIEGSK